ncbi:MAG: sensor histidine kinase, partial [Peptostreptococcaceae bacterium]
KDKDIFDSYIKNGDDILSSVLRNLEYYAINNENKIIVADDEISTNLSNILDEKLNENATKEFNDKYRFYMVFNYDQHGNLSVSDIDDFDANYISGEMENSQNNMNDLGTYKIDSSDIKPIKNMTYIYAVPKKLIYDDRIYNAVKYEEYNSYEQASYLYINMAMAFIVLVTLIIPYREIESSNILKKIKKLPLEIVCLTIAFAVAFVYLSGEIVLVPTIKGELIQLKQLELSKQTVTMLSYLINVIYYSVLFTIISLGVLLVKDILKTGIKKYLGENSLIIRFIKYILKSIKSIFSNLTNMDLKDKNTSKMTKLMILNLIAISVFCSFWFFGIIAALVYSIVIFIFVKRKYAKINSDYNKLLKITNEIANGNLEVNTSEDMGMFNSLKSEISHIQKGFKNAVKEEVKSQKMKTELISNVSHDLKTPLTSIITYVDLLKDENLSEDKKEQYLEVLDRKSQRLKELIEDLFEVSKATSGDINLNVIDVDVVSLMKQTLLELDDKIVESNLMVKKNLPEHKVILQLDSQRMFRVFENLIINITKYSMRNSRVYIDVLDNEEDVVISFRNIAAEEISYDINEITDRFVRGDKSRNTEGSGLGLAIAKSFVDLHGGTLKVSTDGDLFKVVITLNK